MNQLLSGKEIIKSFPGGEEGRRVLNAVSVDIRHGEFVAIMGPSGSGKSTLLYALSGMDQIDSGSILFHGQNLSGLSEDKRSDLRRTKMGFVFQQPTLLRNLTLLDNIILPLMKDYPKKGKELAEKAKKLMRQMGIEDLAEREITQVSGGQLQRAGICRALMSDPEIIFGDEPTGALNSGAAEEVMDIFSGINRQGTSVLLVTHDAKVAARAGRVLFMKDGNLVGTLLMERYDGKDNEGRTGKIVREMQRLGI